MTRKDALDLGHERGQVLHLDVAVYIIPPPPHALWNLIVLGLIHDLTVVHYLVLDLHLLTAVLVYNLLFLRTTNKQSNYLNSVSDWLLVRLKR